MIPNSFHRRGPENTQSPHGKGPAAGGSQLSEGVLADRNIEVASPFPTLPAESTV